MRGVRRLVRLTAFGPAGFNQDQSLVTVLSLRSLAEKFVPGHGQVDAQPERQPVS